LEEKNGGLLSVFRVSKCGRFRLGLQNLGEILLSVLSQTSDLLHKSSSDGLNVQNLVQQCSQKVLQKDSFCGPCRPFLAIDRTWFKRRHVQSDATLCNFTGHFETLSLTLSCESFTKREILVL